jgi:hypothetical protein
MEIHLQLISGVALGIEYIKPDYTDTGEHCLELDLFMVRVKVFWE